MNRPCRIHFFGDSGPRPEDLPERYHDYLERTVYHGETGLRLLAQNAFYIDFAPSVLRTRVGGTKEEDPVDFLVESISHIEWFYGADVPSPLVPWTPPPPKRLPKGVTVVERDL